MTDPKAATHDTVPLTDYSRALDEIWRLRRALAYEARVTEAHYEGYKTFPKTRRKIAEDQVRRMRLAVRGGVGRAYAGCNDRSLRAEYRSLYGSETLTRNQWESEAEPYDNGSTSGSDQCNDIGPAGNPDEWPYLNEQWSAIVEQVQETLAEDPSDPRQRRHKALRWAAAVCFSEHPMVDEALKQWHTDPVFHARCELLAQMVGQLQSGSTSGTSDGPWTT